MIPSEQEIRDVVEWIKSIREKQDFLVHIDDTQPLLDLAQAYLKHSGDMPNKKEIGEMRYGGCNPDFDRGYNQCHDDCALAMMKKLDGLEKLLLEWAEKDKKPWELGAYNLANAIRKWLGVGEKPDKKGEEK